MTTISNRARRRARKRIAKVNVPVVRVTESSTLLTRREQKLVDERIAELTAQGQMIPARWLDYRYWEIKRKCGFDPDASGRPVAETVYSWWVDLDPHDREELARLSRHAGMRGERKARKQRGRDARENTRETKYGREG